MIEGKSGKDNRRAPLEILTQHCTLTQVHICSGYRQLLSSCHDQSTGQLVWRRNLTEKRHSYL